MFKEQIQLHSHFHPIIVPMVHNLPEYKNDKYGVSSGLARGHERTLYRTNHDQPKIILPNQARLVKRE